MKLFDAAKLANNSHGVPIKQEKYGLTPDGSGWRSQAYP